MFSRIMAGCICLVVVITASCTSKVQRLPVATPPLTPETTATPEVGPSPTATATVTPMPADVINAKNLKQVELLHQYWLAVATAAGVDPYEMDISAVAASPDGRLLAVGGCSKPLEQDLRSGNVYCNSKDPQNSGGIPFLLILDANTEDLVGVIPENKADTTVADLMFTPDGKKLIYAIQPGRFVAWDIASSRAGAPLWEGETSAPRIVISPDGKWIALKTADRVEVWDTQTEKVVKELPAFFRPQFSSDSTRIVVHVDSEFIVYETGTWNELLRFGMPCDCVYALSPNLSLLATAPRAPVENAPIIIWDTATGVQIHSLQAGGGGTAFLSFTPDGQMLWRAGDRGDLTAWDTSEWDFLADNIGGITPIFNLHGFQFVKDGRHYVLYSDLLLALFGLP